MLGESGGGSSLQSWLQMANGPGLQLLLLG